MKDDPYTKRLVELVESAMKYSGVSYSQMAEIFAKTEGKPSTRQAVFKKVKSGSMKATDLMKMLSLLGMKLEVTLPNGVIVPTHPAEGKRVIRTVKGVKYDTKHSCAITNSFFLDGVNEYHDHVAEELYLEPESYQYFLVHYDDGKRERRRGEKKCPWIEMLTQEAAQSFIDMCNHTVDGD